MALQPIQAPANPGASATATIVADPGDRAFSGGNNLARVRIACYLSHAATLYCKWASKGGTLRTWNGAGSGETIPATTFFQRDIKLMPGRNQITIVTGTACTTWEVAVDGTTDQALGQ